MKRVGTGILLLVLLTLAAPPLVCNAADEPGWRTVGFRGGFTAIKRREFFNQFDLFATYGLPWSLRADSGWGIALQLNGAVGRLHAAGETAFLASLGPGVIVDKGNNRGFAFMFGGDINYLTRHRFGTVDLNGNPLFQGHLGLAYRFDSGAGLLYRFQHISNGGLGLHGDGNTGLDMHMFGATWNF